jgi:hypothetical protein
VALAVAALLEAALLVAAGDPNLSRAMSRYLFPVGTALSLGLLLAAFDPAERTWRGQAGVAAIAGLVVGLTLVTARPDRVERLYRQLALNATAAVDRADLVARAIRAAARELEASIPAGSPLWHPLLHSCSTDAAAGLLMSCRVSQPPPGLPVRSGGGQWQTMVGHGRHLAYGGMANSATSSPSPDRLLTAYPR